jgi:hypothetical protein
VTALPAPWRGLLLAAALILTGTSILHAIAFPLVRRAVLDAGLGGTWAPAFNGLWLMFSVHLVLVAGYLAVAAARPPFASDSSLLLCAMLLAADTALLGGFMGPFIGTLLVGLSTALVVIARIIRPMSRSG